MSVTTNVLRFSALGFGVFYGLSHQLSLNSQTKQAAAKHEYDHKQELINKAKAEWAKKNAPPQQQNAVISSGLITDPTDPKFDLEAVLKAAA